MIIILVFFLFLFLILNCNIGIRIIYNNKMTDVSLFLYRFFKYKFDVDNYIRKYVIDEEKKKLNVQELIKNINYTIESKQIISDLMSVTNITKSTIVFKQNFENIYLFISYWNIISNLSYFIKKKFKSVKNEYYMLSNNESNIGIEMIFKVKVYKMLLVFFKNRKRLISVIKKRRRDKKSGASNL